MKGPLAVLLAFAVPAQAQVLRAPTLPVPRVGAPVLPVAPVLAPVAPHVILPSVLPAAVPAAALALPRPVVAVAAPVALPVALPAEAAKVQPLGALRALSLDSLSAGRFFDR